MKLPAFFGHKRSINLLPRDAFETSAIGIVLEWSLVFGKWAVILTQLIVMGAFLYRFTLDRTLTDLGKKIAKDVAVIKSYEQVERDFSLAQKQVIQAKAAMDSQKLVLKTLNTLEQITPTDVWYDRITLTPNTMSVNALSASLPGFGRYLTAVQTNPLFSGIRVGKIESSGTRGAQLQFDLGAKIAGETKQGAKK